MTTSKKTVHAHMTSSVIGCLQFDSALLIYDEGAGFRYFLGADVQTGMALSELCSDHIQFQDSFVMSEGVAGLSDSLTEAIVPGQSSNVERQIVNGDSLSIIQSHFYPELLDSVVNEIEQLTSAFRIPPSEIVILAPYLSDALRFSITHKLEARNIPWRSHRPSRSLRDEPASHALITLAALAHPHWSIHPPKFDVAYALMQSIEGLDLVRAQLLTEIIYRQRDLRLSTFDEIKPEMQERITFSIGNRYSMLRDWVMAYREAEQLPSIISCENCLVKFYRNPDLVFTPTFNSVRIAASLVEIG